MKRDTITYALDAITLLAWATEQRSIQTEKEALYFALFGVASPYLAGAKCSWLASRELALTANRDDGCATAHAVSADPPSQEIPDGIGP